MTPEIQILKELEAETSKMELEAKAVGEIRLALMLNFRKQEIAGVLSVAQTWQNDPPVKGIDPQEDLETYEKATIYVSNAVKVLMENPVNMGNHTEHFEREWAGRKDWND